MIFFSCLTFHSIPNTATIEHFYVVFFREFRISFLLLSLLLIYSFKTSQFPKSIYPFFWCYTQYSFTIGLLLQSMRNSRQYPLSMRSMQYSVSFSFFVLHWKQLLCSLYSSFLMSISFYKNA